ncbi:MAG TPA: galactitol-1-phosphate 5-dehydrogenase [Limnochordia bacterium]|jgi:threonine dehydrogenase-like Zn-dependent dehydrogenase|nr:galactitol-1-phosphate 5-dehydrogenase [Bacillota bacterium]HAN94243.1 galactitol-1-phosphate 5-dehydrogenase [Bacillota bacterium]HOK32201.1 galactitol-1-phosphate 5-dehydrogenase [Limnochordia bacterium]
MKALVLKEYHQLSYEDVPEPHYGPDDLLVQVKACAICGSDVHGLDGSTGRRQPPIIMGHEASGVVAAVGERVQGFAPGDRITFDSTIYCGRCHFCRQGRINLCDNRRVLGVSCDDYRQNGALAEFVAVPSHIAYHLPEGVSFEQAALVEPVSIAVHAVSLAPLNLGDTAVVVGVGTIGLLIIQILRTAGCGQIIALDIDHGKFDLARRFGAAVCWDPREEDLLHRIRSLTKGRGADLAFDAVGLSFTVGQAAGLLRKGGALVLVGNLSPQADLPLQSVVTREIALYGSCASSGEYPICLELIQQGKVDVNSLISATAPLRDGAEWFQRLYNKEPGLLKVVLKP